MRATAGRAARWGRAAGAVGVLAWALTSAVTAPATATSTSISGNFCGGLYLPSGASCHSPNYHTFFSRIQGWSAKGYATCVGVDLSTSGGTQVNQCSSGSVDCTSLCAGASGYAFIHNHDTRGGDYFTGHLVAAS